MSVMAKFIATETQFHVNLYSALFKSMVIKLNSLL